MPSSGLVEGRHALIDADGVFDTVGIQGETFTTAQTRGCSCEQILALSPGEKEGHYSHGCSAELMREFIAAR